MAEERLDYWAKDVAWKDVKKGQLHITNDLLEISTKSFWREAVIAWKLKVSSITAVRLNTERNEIVVESQSGEDVVKDRMVLARAGDVQQAFEKINSLFESLKTLREQQRRDREEAERKAKKEAEQKRQRALESYRALVYATGARLWQTTQSLYRLVLDIRHGNWEAASGDSHTVRDEVASIVASANLPNTPSFEKLDKALQTRNGEQVVNECAESLGELARFINGSEPRNPDHDWSGIGDTVSPAWRHLPYILLLNAAYNENVLRYDIGDRESIKEELVRLQRIARLVKGLFSADLDIYVEQFGKALENRNSLGLWDNDQQLNKYIGSYLSKQSGQQER